MIEVVHRFPTEIEQRTVRGGAEVKMGADNQTAALIRTPSGGASFASVIA